MTGEKFYLYITHTKTRLCVVDEEIHAPCPLCRWADGGDGKITLTPGPDRAVTLLRVRNLLEDRAILRSRADLDNLHRDGWCMDYQQESDGLAREIDRLLDELGSLK